MTPIKKQVLVVLSISFIVFITLLLFIYSIPKPEVTVSWVTKLPYVNALLNLSSFILVLCGLIAIKNRNIGIHKFFMVSALFFSGIFLITYLCYHAFHGDTKFEGTGLVRPVYFFFLISHILASMVQLPMLILTFFWAFRSQWDLHKKLAPWTWPIWLYVSATGVIIFLFLKTYNASY